MSLSRFPNESFLCHFKDYPFQQAPDGFLNPPMVTECVVPVFVHALTPICPSFIIEVMTFIWSIRRYLFYWAMFVVFTIFLPAWVHNKSRIRCLVVSLSLLHVNMIGSTLFLLFYLVFWCVPRLTTLYIWFVASTFSKIIGVDIVVRNAHYFDDKYGKGVVIANHMSVLDTLVGCVNIRYIKDWVPTAKKEVRWFGSYGIALRLVRAIFIDRSNKSAMKDLSEGAKLLFKEHKKNYRIIMFPEGTRNHAIMAEESKNKFLPFKLGAFKLAQENHVPIFPVVISKYYFMEWPRRFERGIVVAKALEPFYIEPEDNLETVALRTKETMQKEFVSLSKEVTTVGETNQSYGLMTAVVCAACTFLIIYSSLVAFNIFEDINCFEGRFKETI